MGGGDLMTTGQRIKAYRKKRGLTQEELGSILGVSGSMIAQWETDKRKPKYGTLKKLADALDVWVYDLSSSEDTRERIKRLEDFFASDELDYTTPPPMDKSKKHTDAKNDRIQRQQ